MFKINNKEYKGVSVASLSREWEVMDSDNTHRGQTLEMYRDPLGTLIKYTITLRCNALDIKEYDELVHILMTPVDHHLFTFPFGQKEYTFMGYVTKGKDDLLWADKERWWEGLNFSVTAIDPKMRNIGGVIHNYG